MSSSIPLQYQPQNIDLTPRRHHGYSFLLFIMGTLLPPLAVAARFGVGSDFWLNVLLTLCGYIPGHGHNFYIQNIRNNKNKARTPKWIRKYGLVDTSEIDRKQRKSQWANRYNDRLPNSTLEGRPYEEGQQADSSVSVSSDGQSDRRSRQNGDLWRNEDESYYNTSTDASSSGRWHYPANFDDAAIASSGSKRHRKKKEKKDRWARTEDAYSVADQESQGKKKKKKSKSSRHADTASTYSRDSGNPEFPEDPEGGLYQSNQPETGSATDVSSRPKKSTTDDVFQHEF